MSQYVEISENYKMNNFKYQCFSMKIMCLSERAFTDVFSSEASENYTKHINYLEGTAEYKWRFMKIKSYIKISSKNSNHLALHKEPF